MFLFHFLLNLSFPSCYNDYILLSIHLSISFHYSSMSNSLLLYFNTFNLAPVTINLLTINSSICSYLNIIFLLFKFFNSVFWSIGFYVFNLSFFKLFLCCGISYIISCNLRNLSPLKTNLFAFFVFGICNLCL